MRLVRTTVSILVLSWAALAQSDRGTITGTVSDPAGAIVANAAIQAKNVGTGGLYDGVSTATGITRSLNCRLAPMRLVSPCLGLRNSSGRA